MPRSLRPGQGRGAGIGAELFSCLSDRSARHGGAPVRVTAARARPSAMIAGHRVIGIPVRHIHPPALRRAACISVPLAEAKGPVQKDTSGIPRRRCPRCGSFQKSSRAGRLPDCLCLPCFALFPGRLCKRLSPHTLTSLALFSEIAAAGCDNFNPRATQAVGQPTRLSLLSACKPAFSWSMSLSPVWQQQQLTATLTKGRQGFSSPSSSKRPVCWTLALGVS